MYRVLLVDDEPIVLSSLSAILPWDLMECQLVGTALNGMDAYNKICDEYPDIVITDIKMPLLNGLELIEKAKKLDADIDFVVLSGYDDFAFAQSAMKFGVKDYHLKPVRKEELTATLKKIIAERRQREHALLFQERQFLEKLKLPLQKSFLFDAFNSPGLSEETLKRYTHLLGFPQGNVICFIASFLEPAFLSRFQEEFYCCIRRLSIGVLWPAFYVTNSFVFLYTADDLTTGEQLQRFIKSRSWPGQSVELECQFIHFETITCAYREIIRKISRYQTIQLINELQPPEEILNPSLTAHSFGAAYSGWEGLSNQYEAQKLLQDAFAPVSDVDTAILLCIRLLFSSPLFSAKEDFDFHTLQLLFRSGTVEEVQNLALRLLSGRLPVQASKNGPQKATLIPRVKEYVNAHLDSETLSLKWLAENQFFVSVGYLSKQFQQEEGEHFSHYLNRQRVALAKKLMTSYHNSNIQEVALLVGFRNNPRYFSQVFKKYTGMTPSEYLAGQKEGAS